MCASAIDVVAVPIVFELLCWSTEPFTYSLPLVIFAVFAFRVPYRFTVRLSYDVVEGACAQKLATLESGQTVACTHGSVGGVDRSGQRAYLSSALFVGRLRSDIALLTPASASE